MRGILLVLAFVAACGGASAVAAPSAAEVGSYTLESIDGHLLPATVAEGGSSVSVQSSTMTLASGGGIHMTVVYQLTGQPSATNVLDGHYTRQGNNLSFTYSNGGANAGSIAGDTLRMNNEGVVWLYRKS